MINRFVRIDDLVQGCFEGCFDLTIIYDDSLSRLHSKTSTEALK